MKDKSVKEINAIIDSISTDEYLKYIDILKDDERKSVKNIAIKLAPIIADVPSNCCTNM